VLGLLGDRYKPIVVQDKETIDEVGEIACRELERPSEFLKPGTDTICTDFLAPNFTFALAQVYLAPEASKGPPKPQASFSQKLHNL